MQRISEARRRRSTSRTSNVSRRLADRMQSRVASNVAQPQDQITENRGKRPNGARHTTASVLSASAGDPIQCRHLTQHPARNLWVWSPFSPCFSGSPTRTRNSGRTPLDRQPHALSTLPKSCRVDEAKRIHHPRWPGAPMAGPERRLHKSRGRVRSAGTVALEKEQLGAHRNPTCRAGMTGYAAPWWGADIPAVGRQYLADPVAEGDRF
jgi:hypothetical protein